MTDVYKALADPTRRAILDELSERDGQTLFELCSRLATKHSMGSTRQAISQHVGVLESDEVIAPRRGRVESVSGEVDPWPPGCAGFDLVACRRDRSEPRTPMGT